MVGTSFNHAASDESAEGEDRRFLSKHATGTLICILGVLMITPDALLLRKLEDVEPFTIILFRGLLYIGATAILLFAMNGRNALKSVTDLGAMGTLTGVVWGGSQLMITYALLKASVGSVLVINSANPMFSAIFSRILLGETVKLRTVIAGLVCFAAIFVIFISEAGDSSGSVGGILCALGASSTMGLYFTLLRYTEVSYGYVPDSNACNIIAGVFSSIVSIAVLKGSPGHPSSIEWVYLFLDGAVAMTLSYLALSIGPSMISAPEVSLCTLLETAVGPVWVFLAGYERPTNYAIGGGAALVVALSVHSFLAMSDEGEPSKTKEANSGISNDDVEQGDVILLEAEKDDEAL